MTNINFLCIIKDVSCGGKVRVLGLDTLTVCVHHIPVILEGFGLVACALPPCRYRCHLRDADLRLTDSS